MNHLDLFSGIGGFALAAQMAGLPIKAHYNSEIDEYANQVYAQHFPKAVNLGDIKTIDATQLKQKHKGAWLVTGGFPCQDLSTAGLRRGLSGDRSGLWWEMHRVISELRPAYVLIENVPTLSYRGLERVLFSLAASGYDAEWQVVSASQLGAPHVRKRLWIVAYPNGTSVPVGYKLPARCGDVGNDDELDGATDAPLPWLDGPPAKTCWNQPDSLYRASRLCRVDDGIPFILDRVKAIGNSIVPQVAAGILAKFR